MKVIENMKKNDLSSLIISSPDAIFYLTGETIHPGERLMTLVVTISKKITLVLPTMFEVSQTPFEVKYFSDDEKPLEWVAELIDTSGSVGIDKDWPARFLLGLMELCPDVSFVNGSAAVDKARLNKDSEEVVLMKEASLLNDRAMEKVRTLLESGNLTEVELKRRIPEIFSSVGAGGNSFEPIVCFGKGAAEPHHHSDETELQQGSIIIDMGCVYKGYCSDMTRSFYYGEVSDKYAKAYEAVLAGNEAALSLVKPGVRLSAIDHAARSVIEKAGFGEYFVHRTGHGIGIEVHEFPDVSASSDAVCEPGMIFSVEPGVYIKNEFGIRIEDLVLVTEDGHEVLNRYPKDLSIIHPKG
ncbi:aminopeptidase P family protein [Fusibacter sp. A1]|nr:aminopeptidase P family protein [Fusibacter sp. A1]